MTVKNNHKPNLLFLLLTLTTLLPSPTLQATKCNRQLMNEFGLEGMPESVNDGMHVCVYVRDKCCTIPDEIKILKYWQSNTKPQLDRFYSLYLSTMNLIVKNFIRLMKADPRLMVLKHVQYKSLPYTYKMCSAQQLRETPSQRRKFERAEDDRIQSEIAPDFYSEPGNKGKKFDVNKFVLDKDGKRHWTYKQSPGLVGLIEKLKGLITGNDDNSSEPEYTSIKCKTYGQKFSKEFVVVNEVKSDFCLDVYEKFLLLDVKQLQRFLPIVSAHLRDIHDMKASLYCTICNVHEQQYFDAKSKSLVMSENFCKAFLTEHFDFVRFTHIVFIEYMDEMLQYIQCFETDAKVFDFPFTNFLIKYKRRIPFIKECLASLNKGDMKDKCWFICNKYNLMRYSPFFDGDVKLIRRIYITVLSFLRKMTIETKENSKIMKKNTLLTFQNVNGLLIEPLNPGHAMSKHYYLRAKDRKKILGSLDTRRRIPHKSAKKLLTKFLHELGAGKVKDIKSLTMKSMKKKKKKKGKKGKKRKRKGVSKVNGTYNYFHKDLSKKKLHAGLYPIRKLSKQKLSKERKLFLKLPKFNFDPKSLTSLANKATSSLNPKNLQDMLKKTTAGLNPKNLQDMIKKSAGALNPAALSKMINDASKNLSPKGIENLIKTAGKKMSLKEINLLLKKTGKNLSLKTLFKLKSRFKKIDKLKKKARKELKKKGKVKIRAFKMKRIRKNKMKRRRKLNKTKRTVINAPYYSMNRQDEPSAPFYESNKEAIGYINFNIATDKDGMDPFKNRKLVDFKFNITSLIGLKFAREEDINNSVIVEYMSTTAKFRNRFNFDFNSEIKDYNSVNPPGGYRKAKKIAKYAKLNKRVALLTFAQAKLRKIENRKKRAENRKEMMDAFKKQQKSLNAQKNIDKLNGNKTQVYNHKEAWSVPGNFDGIRDAFVGFFGK